MKRILFAAITICIMLALTGCGGSSPPPTFVTQILSHPAFDGDVELDTANVFHVTQGNVASVFAGRDPATGAEFRAFLDFSLTGSGGVPGNAFIESAVLDIFVDSLTIQAGASSIPIRIELVSFPPQTLLASDFDRTIQPPLALAKTFIFSSDVSHHVSIDVTSLMVQAQASGLANFQVRILEDFGAVPEGLVEIDDTTVNRAPLLTVTYH